MTDDEIAAQLVRVQGIELQARAYWDGLSHGRDGEEYTAVMSIVRQAGMLRASLERWILSRATRAQRRTQEQAHG